MGHKAERTCERCATELSDKERRWGTALCDGCWDSWFRHYKRRVLVAFCLIAMLLEASMNAGPVAPALVALASASVGSLQQHNTYCSGARR